MTYQSDLEFLRQQGLELLPPNDPFYQQEQTVLVVQPPQGESLASPAEPSAEQPLELASSPTPPLAANGTSQERVGRDSDAPGAEPTYVV